jgi:hypothetical protein
MQPAKGAGQQAGNKGCKSRGLVDRCLIFGKANFKSSLNASVLAPDAVVVGVSPVVGMSPLL